MKSQLWDMLNCLTVYIVLVLVWPVIEVMKLPDLWFRLHPLRNVIKRKVPSSMLNMLWINFAVSDYSSQCDFCLHEKWFTLWTVYDIWPFV